MSARFAALPLARAHAHLAEGRYSQAVGAFRAALGVDPNVVGAHLGLAATLNALGRRDEAVDGLVSAAEDFSTKQEHDQAMRLLGQALVVDPSRKELHLDLAMVEEAMGRHDDAVARIEGLADRYMDDGRFEEAAELLRLLASWEDDEQQLDEQQLDEQQETEQRRSPAPVAVLEHEEPVAVAVAVPEAPAPIAAEPEGPRNTALITGETVIALNPLLFPFPTSEPARPAAPAREAETDAETRITVVPGGVRRSVPASSPRPAARPVPARPDVVQRLKARAGLGASPRRASARETEPITTRPPSERWVAQQDEDVTRYFRRPRGLDAAS